MAMEGDKWRVQSGDCLWNIAKSVYGDPYRWRDIASANGINQSTAIIHTGQLLTLPGKSSSAAPAPQPVDNTAKKVTFQWFALDAGTERSMFAAWTYTRDNTDHYEVKWYYDTGQGGWRLGSDTTVAYGVDQSAYTADTAAKKVKLVVKPISKTKSGSSSEYYWTDGQEETREYDFSNNPPLVPDTPDLEITQFNVLTAELTNIDEDINATTIEFAIYQDNTYKYKTAQVPIDLEARYAVFTCDVDPGHYYKIRARGVRGDIYGGWSDYSDNDQSTPVAPKEITTLRSQIISEEQARHYAVFAEWPEETSAKVYLVQWTTNPELFDTGEVESQTTEEGAGPRLLITNIELGHRYYFRVASVNDKGQSNDWSTIKSVEIGTRPTAPTTYSNVVSCILGEDFNLYWVHNSTDGSFESYARLHLLISDSAHPELEPLEIVKVIENTRPEEEKGKTSVYTINTDDPEWATIGEGYIIKWKVQTAGITSEYSDWSVEREANVYAKPTVEVGILNNQSISVDEVNNYPFYFSVTAGPSAQTPISYYIEVVSNEAYETLDAVGKVKMIGVGDKVYQKYYDPQENPWRFLLEMTPGNIDLKNDINYTVNVTVSMNSGLITTDSKDFDVYFDDRYYDVYADVYFNELTLEASIHPYCYQYEEDEGEIIPSLVDGCKLAVYRRNFDGTFTEIAKNIDNTTNLYVVDPHPSLDYARYRVVAKTDDTGALSYCDIPAIKVGKHFAVIQWAEEWSSFQSDDNGVGTVEPPWSGSMIKIPYNITIADSKKIDVELVEYAGRQHPVSYYGTQLGETSTWSMMIPKSDKETLYSLRRLAIWTGDVYVREPYGTGYWANINVSYNLKYSDVVVPVTFNITRVEGGI